MNLNPGKFFGTLVTKLSQLTNDSGFATPATINSTVVPRYAKQHTTQLATPDTLTVNWPVGRFTDVPIMPDPTVVTPSSTAVYKAIVIACSATGCTIKVTQQPMVSANLLGLTNLTLQSPVTSIVKVNVFAIQQTD
jgi:hypothetical protein